MKPGIRTTEMWLALAPYILAMVAVGATATGYLNEGSLTIVLSALGFSGAVSSFGYSRSRAQVKAGGEVLPVELEEK